MTNTAVVPFQFLAQGVPESPKVQSNFESLSQYLLGRDVVSVKDYGAIGDGSADDTAAFIAAFATGKDVFVPGTTAYYKLSTTPTITTSNQRIFGVGNMSKVVQTGTEVNSTVFLVSGVTGVVVEDIYFVPSTTTSSLVYGYGVFIQNSSKCTVRNCLFTGYLRGCVGIYISDYCVIEGNLARDSAFANTFATMGTDWFVLYGGNNNSIHRNTSIGSGTGAAVQTLAGGGTAYGNCITNNCFKNMGGYAITVYRDIAGGAGVLEHSLIANNEIDGVTGNINHPTDGYVYGTGIYAQGAEYTNIVGNVVYNTCQNTVVDQLAPGAIGSTNCSVVNISGNVIRKTGIWSGITVRDPNGSGASTGFANVSSNNIYDCKDGIQVVERGRVKISDNVMDTCTQRGVFVNNTVTKRPLISITDNQIRNVLIPISVAYASQARVADNDMQLWGTGGNYAITFANADNIEIEDNGATNPNAGGYGINIDNSITDGFAQGNLVTGTVVGFASASRIKIGDNHIFGNTTNYSGTFGIPWTLTANSATPSVQHGKYFITANSNPTTVTNFTNPVDGQEIVIVVKDANTTISFSGASIKGNGGVNWAATTSSSARCVNLSGVWYCTIETA